MHVVAKHIDTLLIVMPSSSACSATYSDCTFPYSAHYLLNTRILVKASQQGTALS
jgi:hypothetical protein